MLVKAKQNATWTTANVLAGEYYIVFAIENKNTFYVIPFQTPKVTDMLDPLPFPADVFEVVADRSSSDWQTHECFHAQGSSEYTSFPEWFQDSFWIRAHDWNLLEQDHEVIARYKQAYEKVYAPYLQS